MSAPVRMEAPPVPLRSAGGSGACCTVSESAAPIAAVPSTAAARCAQAYAADRRQHRRVIAPEQGDCPALPMRRAATGLRRRARRLPDRVLVNRLQKEHPA